MCAIICYMILKDLINLVQVIRELSLSLVREKLLAADLQKGKSSIVSFEKFIRLETNLCIARRNERSVKIGRHSWLTRNKLTRFVSTIGSAVIRREANRHQIPFVNNINNTMKHDPLTLATNVSPWSNNNQSK